jgi:hypothetical protein
LRFHSDLTIPSSPPQRVEINPEAALREVENALAPPPPPPPQIEERAGVGLIVNADEMGSFAVVNVVPVWMGGLAWRGGREERVWTVVMRECGLL